jgi:predicted nucleotidyltransferase
MECSYLYKGNKIKLNINQIIDYFENGYGKKIINIYKNIKYKINYLTMYSILILFIIQQFIALTYDDILISFVKDIIKINEFNINQALIITYVGEFLAKGNMLFLIISIFILCILFFLDYIDKTVVNLEFKNLKKASPTIKKLLDDNKRIFKTHGPNSSSQSVDDIRNNEQIPIWNTIKKTKIIPNNERIYSILENIKKYDNSEIPLIESMKNHIEAFKEHVMGESFINYTNHQFPIKFSILISKYANNGLLNSNFYKKYLDWINVYIKQNQHNIKFKDLFGSSLYDKEPSDIDILIFIESDNFEVIKDNAKLLNTLSKDFNEKFGKKLHITTFSEKEIHEYKKFKKLLLDTKEF